MLAKIRITFQLRLFLNEPPGSLIAPRPVFPENATDNLTFLSKFPQPFLHGNPDVPAFTA